ncbi:hypothetical protein [Ramlibacter tataouinensis]|uniref:Uncharacterized protein n=1 Tax=Ramlibacter tataouinensis TaxID=94132 RepID=A0A127JZU9_9BURK|nr:hypothetical protein [Ramlibacter tataouinensis]AMO23662.1 hypothetical protein UC35_13175 [Ramlibacter tataouinensis]
MHYHLPTFVPAERANPLPRDAVQLELESELRGLIMAARMHGFRIAIEGPDMSYSATDVSLTHQSQFKEAPQ